jgi:hypothetical protein
MRGSLVGLVVVTLIALALLYTYRPDMIESWTNWLLFTR